MLKDKRLVGSCQAKCPKREEEFRIKNQLLHPLECAQPFEKIPLRNRCPIHERICKVYSRPAANQTILLETVRSPAALKESLDYLLEVEEEFGAESQWSLVYEFLTDRFRAIRQDIIVQQLNDAPTSYLLEQMICFYVRARQRSEMLKTPTYNATLHARELDECLERWTHFESKSPELRVLYLLYSIHNPDIFAQLRSQCEFIANDTYRLLWNLFSAYTLKNYVHFFRLVSKFDDTLRKQILTPAIKHMRVHAFNTIAASSKSPTSKIPVENLKKWLSFTDVRALKKCADEYFETSPIDKQLAKFHGCKIKALDCGRLSYEWSIV